MKTTPVNKLGITNDKELEIAEGEITSARIAELIEHPIDGSFNASHLKSIHGYIFQDLYGHAGSFHEVTEIRATHRVSELNGARRTIFYPSIVASNKFLDSVLLDITSKAITNPNELVKNLVKSYAQLDYLHMFQDGNSRTLRYFLTCAANRVNLGLDWATTNVDGVSRERLYAARDRAVLQQVKHDVRSEAQLKMISHTIYELQDQPSLEDIMLPMFLVLDSESPAPKFIETGSEVCQTCIAVPSICGGDGRSRGTHQIG